MNSEKVETWHGIIISPTQRVQKGREGYGTSWTHFVYKLDNLFRSIRVSDENSCVTWALHFLKIITTPDFFAFRTHHSKRRHQFSKLSDILCFFQSFTDLFKELNDREIENHYKMNSQNVETWHGIIIHPHSMCKRVERVTVKIGRTYCTIWTISFEVSGFLTRNHLLHGHFIF